jgi:hypothetical protein
MVRCFVSPEGDRGHPDKQERARVEAEVERFYVPYQNQEPIATGDG